MRVLPLLLIVPLRAAVAPCRNTDYSTVYPTVECVVVPLPALWKGRDDEEQGSRTLGNNHLGTGFGFGKPGRLVQGTREARDQDAYGTSPCRS